MSNLLRISEASSLALHTMALLAKMPDRHLSNAGLAGILRASEHTLSKVLQRLVKARPRERCNRRSLGQQGVHGGVIT